MLERFTEGVVTSSFGWARLEDSRSLRAETSSAPTALGSRTRARRKTSPWRPAASMVALLLLLVLPRLAAAQSVDVQIESREVYAGLPFVLSFSASGFQETPEPTISDFDIEGCRVTFLGITPQVSSMIQIINGVRSERRDVTFIYRYRVEAPSAGSYTVPSVTVEQGSTRVATRPGTFQVREIEQTADMRLRLVLPDRPVWLGETVEVYVDWLLRRDADDQNIVVPMFDQTSDFAVSAPPNAGGRALPFVAGARDIYLPFEQSNVVEGGVQYTRLRFTALVTPLRSGAIEIPASRVAARLQVGVGRDRFGFRTAQWQLFQAEDVPRTLEVRPLPQSGRPSGFDGAVGSGFSIQVEASRTVVRLGDPIELTITIRGSSGLEGLRLPPLDADGGLEPSHFSVPDEQPVGEWLDDRTGKRFRVTVRIQSTGVSEIPAIPFSYFDPVAGEYRTVNSDPIALSVAGSAVVRADDVFVGGGQESPEGSEPTSVRAAQPALESLVGADLSLSDPDETLSHPMSLRRGWVFVAALYVVPLLIWLGRAWQLRTRTRRGERAEVRSARSDLKRQLERASREPARVSGPALVGALQALARAQGVSLPTNEAVVARLEIEAYAPTAGSDPLSRELLDDVRRLGDQLAASPARSSKGRRSVVATTLIAWLCTVIATSGLAIGQEGADPADPADAIDVGRRAYQEAMAAPDRAEQADRFGLAAERFAEAVRQHPDRPELLTDWGNAALGARDLGTATLAYRRAVYLDSTLERAQKNLTWLRERQPAWLPRPQPEGAVEALFFWRHSLTHTHRHLLAAAAFALGILLLVPWSVRLRSWRTLRYLAVIPFAAWLLLLGSMTLERDESNDAVVMVDETVLRSADSVGAPPAFANPLPEGTEVTVVEHRTGWVRVQMANGLTGWLPDDTTQLVVEPTVEAS